MKPNDLHRLVRLPRCTWNYLLLWLAVPVVFRLVVFVVAIAPQAPGGILRLKFLAQCFIIGLPQDLLVALEMWLVALAAMAVANALRLPARTAVVAGLLTAVFAATHIYLLFDVALYTKIGLRLDPDLATFAADWRTLWSSAQELGLAPLVAGLAVLGISLTFIFRFLHRTVGELEFSPRLLATLPLVAVLAIGARLAIPGMLAYATDNALARDQAQLAASAADAWQGKGTAYGADDADLAHRYLTPQGEHFTPVDPQYPLLKDTHGFCGERLFDLSIAPEERPHVVFLFLESFRGRDVGALGGRHNVTPNFDRLAQQGILFTQFYGNGVQTTRAVVSSLFGVPPRFSTKSVQAANSSLPLIGVADLFNRRGYRSAYFYGGSLEFENQEAFFRNHGYAETHGENELQERFGAAARTSWGYHDQYLLDYVADWLESREQQGQPGFATVFTITNHHPWRVPEDFKPAPNDVPPEDEYHRYLQTVQYTDQCLGRFMEKLQQRGLDRKTVFFILADTGTPMGEHHRNYMLINYLYDEGLHIPLLILAPSRTAGGQRVDVLGSQVDLLPTVMDIFQMTGLNHAVGTSLARDVPRRQVFFNNPFALQYQGMRQGDWKFVECLCEGRSYLYDVARDPQETKNLAADNPRQAAEYQAASAAVNAYMLRLYLSGRIAPRDSGQTGSDSTANPSAPAPASSPGR